VKRRLRYHEQILTYNDRAQIEFQLLRNILNYLVKGVVYYCTIHLMSMKADLSRVSFSLTVGIATQTKDIALQAYSLRHTA
jgi:hypothetical protein